ncbi:MAG: type IV secretion system DNA-binding domain-containing protein [Candidatus Roizmanbacteria bacterium]|nr:type IV secretion system DNA-binding domain-containing protein [Candidatus Roizmanbacteria bacterium]
MDLSFLDDIAFRAQIIFVVLVIIAAALAGIIVLSYAFILWLKVKNREEKALDYMLLQVAVPRDNEIKIDAAEQFFSSFASLKKSGWKTNITGQPHMTFEIVATPGDIRFYISVPKKLRDFIEKQVYGAYPGADIRPVPEYNIFTQSGKVAFTSLKLAHEDYKPIKIYRDLPTDPLSSVTASLSRMQKGEGAAIQIVIAPAAGDWKSAGKDYVSSTKKKEATPDEAEFTTDQRELESISNKLSKPGFDTIVRIVVSAPTQESADSHLDNLSNAFTQFSSPLNEFSGAKVRIKQFFMIDFIYRYFPVTQRFGKQSSVLSSEELATVFHFPNKAIETPHIFWLNAKRAPAAANIPTSGMFLGTSRYRGDARPIYISDDDRRRHMYIIGKTGVGKSEFLKAMALQDIKNGKGLAVVDPHGDLVEELLPLIPPERAEDVIYFDPSDTERPMGFNLLEAHTEEQKHLVTTSIIGLMYKLYDPMKTGIIGPRFEHAVRNAMLTVMSVEGSTFIEVVRVLTDAKFVQEILPQVKDPVIRRYWTDQIAQTSDFHKSETLDYIVSKFGRFVTNKTMRNIIGQSDSAFNFRKVMDEGKILLVNLSKGKIGEENSNFLGLVLVPKILVAAMSRQDVPQDQRKDFYLYVDEFQNFATPDFAQILSEARKYRLNLTVANQFIGQMDEEIKNAIFGNVGTLVTFRVGVTDASYMQREYQPIFNEADLINIERFHAYVRTIVDNEPVLPFSMDMTRDIKAEKETSNAKVAEAIKKLSSLKYGRARDLIEAEINQRARL